MPVLKDLVCSIELSEGKHTLSEYGTTYSDGCVETFVPVPHKPQSFSVHLKSDRFIAPGLAMYIFIDGVYQCNRNRQDLKLRKGSDSRSVVDFRVRQKEEKQKDGLMIAREWRFEKMNTSANHSTATSSPTILGNIGSIEVIVLRCAGTRSAKSALAMNTDGAGDYDYEDRRSHKHSSVHTAYDDRSPHLTNLSHRPPPPVHLPTSQVPLSTFPGSHHSHPPSTYSGHPGSAIPPNAFWYGSGPVPAGPAAPEYGAHHVKPQSTVTPHTPGVDSAWLDDLLTKAVQRGVEASRTRVGATNIINNVQDDVDKSSQLPGAWPSDSDSTWDKTDDEGDKKTKKSSRRSHVAWDDGEKWESRSAGDNWETNEETPTHSWDTGENWATKKTNKNKSRKQHADSVQSKRSASRSGINGRNARRDGSQRHHSRSRAKSRSPKTRRHESEAPSSSDDGRRRVNLCSRDRSMSSSSSFSDDTVQPSHSMSQFHTSGQRSRSHHTPHKSHSDRTKSKRSSQYSHGDVIEQRKGDFAAPAFPMPPPIPPPALQATPTAPIYNWQGIAQALPPPQTVLTGTVPPPPFVMPQAVSQAVVSVPWDAEGPSRATSISSSSWGSTKKNKKVKDSREASDRTDKWKDSEDDGWHTDANEDDWGNAKKEDVWTTKENTWSPKPKAESKIDDSWEVNDSEWTTKEQGINTWDTKPSKDTTKEKWTSKTTLPSPKKYEEKTPKYHSSKRHTTKSLAHYRKHSSKPTTLCPLSPTTPTPQPHWTFPPSETLHPTTHHRRSSSNPPTLAPEPLHTISAKTASETGIQHQVRAGEGSEYGHAVSRPEYLDTLDKPYAVFRFKYRGEEVLRGMFGDGGNGKDTRGEEARKENDKGRDKGRRSKRDSPRDGKGKVKGFTEEWVERQSKGVGEQGEKEQDERKREKEGRRRKSRKDGDDSWDKSGWD